MTDDSARPPSRQETASIGDVVDTVKAYAKQETIGPLQRAGKYVGYGAAGGLLTGLGVSLVLLGLLRFVQSEWDRLATGRLSWLAYVVTLVGVVVLGGASMWYANRQIKKSITDEDRT